MAMQPLATAVEPLMQAVHGAAWVHYDPPHRRLYVGRRDLMIYPYDVVTGQPYDQPWPVSVEQATLVGYDAACHAAVTERINAGY